MNNELPQSIEDGLLQWYRRRVRASEQITVETDLLDAGYLDSLMLMELVASLEEQYGIAIGPEEMSPQHFRSIRSLASFVTKRSAV
jgi:acyl carrier protein